MEQASTGVITVVEGQAGAGKSTLLREVITAHDGPVAQASLAGRTAGRGQLRRRLHASLRLNGLSDLTAVLEQAGDTDPVPDLVRWLAGHDEPLLITIDDVHLADTDLAHLLAALAESLPVPHRLLLAGRRVPDTVRAALRTITHTFIGPADLRFTTDETRCILHSDVARRLTADDLALLTDRCDGWAAAVVLADAHLQRALATSGDGFSRQLSQLLAQPTTLPDLLRSLLDDVPARERAAVVDLAVLPMFDDELVVAAGVGGGAAAVADLGIPLEEVRDGLWTFPNAVRGALAPASPNERLIRQAAQRYVDTGWPSAALEVLDATGLQEDLAKLLADLPPVFTGRIDAAEHAAAVGAVPPDLLNAHPRILIHLADTYLVDGHLEDYRASIGRARMLLGGQGPDTRDLEALEVLAADCAVRLVASDDDVLIAEAETILARDDLPPMARGRLLAAVGRATAGRRTATALRTGARQLEEAAQLLQSRGAPTHAIATRVVAATVASWPLGRYDAALEQLDQVLAASGGNVRIRVSTLPYRAFILIEVGRYAEAHATLTELRHTASTVATIGNERSAAFARWGAAKLASQQGDADTTWAACHAVERSDVVVDTGHGAFFRADAAQLLARVGRLDEAERLLADARQRDPGTTPLVTTAEFVVAAYAGDVERATAALVELDSGLAVEPRDRWRITLLHAAVLHEAGDDRAEGLAAAAFEEAAQLGYPDLPFVREPEVARVLQPLAARSSSSARDRGAAQGPRITVLGALTVEIDGHPIEPTGRPAELIAFLALHGAEAPTEQVIEALWPDGETDRGRERLRTVLRRVRQDVGDLVERHAEQLRFRPGVTVDADDFLRFVREARNPDGTGATAASAALGLYGDAVAPSLGLLPWIEQPRRHLEQQALAMYDVVATAAEEEARLDDAVRALLAAIALDPLAEDRYLSAARLLAEQGRRSRALNLLTTAASALGEAGLPISRDLGRLRGYLERTATRTSHAS